MSRSTGARPHSTNSSRTESRETWAAVKVPVLVLRGEYDWIMPREDGSAIVESVNQKAPPLAKYVELPRVGHGLTQFDSLDASTKVAGEYYQPVEGIVAEFLKGVLK